MVTLNKMPAIYWSNTTKLSFLQRRIIVYSIMYYEHNESCISDKEYDSISKQLVELMSESTNKECEDSMYWYAMYDFDGSTGFDIPGRLTKKDREYLTNVALNVYKLWKSERRENDKVKRIG